MLTDTAALLIYDMIAVKDFSPGFAKIGVPLMFAYQPATQQTADVLKAKLGEKVRLERFEGAGHALFVDDAEKFTRVLEEFIHAGRRASAFSIRQSRPSTSGLFR